MVRWLRVAALAGAIAAIVGAATPAWADTTVDLQVGASAASATCDGADGADSPAGDDVWIFQLTAGALTSITATFTTATGEVASVGAGNGAASTATEAGIAGGRMSGLDGARGWVATPPGWKLVAARAEATGDAAELELVAACQAVDNPGAIRDQPTLVLDLPPTQVPAAPKALAQLPTTGVDVASMLMLGTSLTVGGILLLLVRQRRGYAPRHAAEGPDDIRRAIVVAWRE